MLLLSRQKKQRVRITGPDGVSNWLTLTGVSRGSANLGFEFDKSYEIVREEAIQQPGINHDGGPDTIDGAPSDGWIRKKDNE